MKLELLNVAQGSKSESSEMLLHSEEFSMLFNLVINETHAFKIYSHDQ